MLPLTTVDFIGEFLFEAAELRPSHDPIQQLPASSRMLLQWSYFTPASTWGRDQLHALNVKVLLEVDDYRIIPGEYIPNDDDKGRLLSSIDDLQDFDRDDFPSNDFVGLFNSLSTCVETGTSEETIFNGERPEGTALLPVAIQAKPDVDEGGGLTNGW
ncbi:hypothetical protein V8E54_004199 [Elaphomyces granulatus]